MDSKLEWETRKKILKLNKWYYARDLESWCSNFGSSEFVAELKNMDAVEFVKLVENK